MEFFIFFLFETDVRPLQVNDKYALADEISISVIDSFSLVSSSMNLWNTIVNQLEHTERGNIEVRC